MKNKKMHTDVIVIGAGPVGLFSVFECGMMGLKCHIIDALQMVGGQCAALYPEKPIYDIPAFPEISAQALVDQLKIQAASFNPTYHLSTQATKLTKEEDRWHVTTSTGQCITSKAIIISAGVGAFGPKRPPLEHLSCFEASGAVQYFICSRQALYGKKIVIAGGGDSALDWVISLSTLAEKITLVHRREKFRAVPESINQLNALVKEGKVDKAIPYQLKAVEGDLHTGTLKHVVLSHIDGTERVICADVLLPFFGLSTHLGPLADWPLKLEKNHIIVNPTTMATSIPGIFAIGDIATYPHKLRLILTGFSEAAQAAHQIRSYLFPNQVFHFEYSTTKGSPLKR